MERRVGVTVTFRDTHGNGTVKVVWMNLPDEVLFEREEKRWAMTERGERLAREKVFDLYNLPEFSIYSGVYLG